MPVAQSIGCGQAAYVDVVAAVGFDLGRAGVAEGALDGNAADDGGAGCGGAGEQPGLRPVVVAVVAIAAAAAAAREAERQEDQQRQKVAVDRSHDSPC